MAKANEPHAMPMSQQRVTITHLQRMKDEGKPISMVGTASCDPLWVAACERAGVNLVRYTAPGDAVADRIQNLIWHTRNIRKLAPNVCLNAFIQSVTYADKYSAVRYASELMAEGADSVEPMAVTNETLKYMSDHYIPVFGHVGCLSGWQIAWSGGYTRMGKTAKDAMDIFRMAYEYQENGMVGMTIELTSREVTDLIAKKLRIPVIEVAAGGVADGSELVIFDLLGFQPVSTMPKHSKYYREFFEDGIKAFQEFDADVKNKVYPAEEHGWGMDEREFDAFANEVEQKYPDVK